MASLRGIPLKLYNSIHRRIWPASKMVCSLPELNEIANRAAHFPSDISDHLLAVFSEAAAKRPRLIVELGVRGGESRFVFERVAALTGAALVSVDMDDCNSVCNRSPLWHFVQSDDIRFAELFGGWCRERQMEPEIDVLFIDTSHLFDHTLQEIRSWFPYLSPVGKVIFHDTNMKRWYRRLDGTIGHGWSSNRGVIRAIEEYLGTPLDERRDFVTTTPGWLIRHWSHCNGLTVMERTWLARKADERSPADRSEYLSPAPVSSH